MNWVKVILLSFILSNLWSNAVGEDVLIIRSSSKDFKEISSGIDAEINEDYTVVDYPINPSTTYREVEKKITKVKPKVLVVLDKSSIQFAKIYTENHPLTNLPIVAMGLGLKNSLAKYPHFCGVTYEVPGYHIITGFRYISKKPIKSILVFFRKKHVKMLKKVKEQMKLEGIRLIGVHVEKEGATHSNVTNFINNNFINELKKHRTDAVWVLPDEMMLSKETFEKTWIPASKIGIPFVSGIRKFSSKKLNFCSYSCAPNNSGISHQMSQFIFAILEDEETPKNLGFEEVLEVGQTLNLSKMNLIRKKVLNNNLKKIEVIR